MLARLNLRLDYRPRLRGSLWFACGFVGTLAAIYPGPVAVASCGLLGAFTGVRLWWAWTCRESAWKWTACHGEPRRPEQVPPPPPVSPVRQRAIEELERVLAGGFGGSETGSWRG